jgi:hypothetical protein
MTTNCINSCNVRAGLESGANDVAVPCESLLTCLMYCLCSDWSDTTLLFARCLGMMIVIEEVKGAMIEAEVEVEVEVEVGVSGGGGGGGGGRGGDGGLDAGATRLYVGRLSTRTRSRDLEDLFAKYGRYGTLHPSLLKSGLAYMRYSYRNALSRPRSLVIVMLQLHLYGRWDFRPIGERAFDLHSLGENLGEAISW